MKAGARAAAQRGGEEFQAGRYAEALDLYLRAESLIHAPTHVLMIARSHMALGQLVLARESYMEIVREEFTEKAPAAFRKARADAEKELKALEPRVPSVEASVDRPSASGLAVTIDGKLVPGALVGVPRPVDPGTHVFRATADGFESAEKSVSINEGEKQFVRLELKPVVAAQGPVKPRPPLKAVTKTASDKPAEPGAKPLRIASLAMMGVGAAGLGIGAAFGVLSLQKRGEADSAFDKCGVGCAGAPANAVRALDDDANIKGNIGIAGLVAGAAIAGGGIAMFFMSRSSSLPAQGSIQATPWISATSAGLSGWF